MISYDPNYRPLLWSSKGAAREQMRALLPFVDLIKISAEECEIVTGCSDPAEAAAYLKAQGICCAVVTLGADGAYISTAQGECRVDGYCPVSVVDTTGAGDAFWGAFLTCVSESGQHIAALSVEKLRMYGDFACAAASLAVEMRGAIPAMPVRESIEERCKQR